MKRSREQFFSRFFFVYVFVTHHLEPKFDSISGLLTDQLIFVLMSVVVVSEHEDAADCKRPVEYFCVFSDMPVHLQGSLKEKQKNKSSEKA